MARPTSRWNTGFPARHPELTVVRPADANETAVAWKVAIEQRHGPTLLA